MSGSHVVCVDHMEYKFLNLFFKYLYLPHKSHDAIQFCSIFTLSDVQFPVAACVAHVVESVMSAQVATKVHLVFVETNFVSSLICFTYHNSWVRLLFFFMSCLIFVLWCSNKPYTKILVIVTYCPLT